MYYTYLLKSKNFPKTYVGITDNPIRRIYEHNSGTHTYTKRYKPWEYIFIEKHLSRIEAHSRELYLKSAAGRRWISKYVF